MKTDFYSGGHTVSSAIGFLLGPRETAQMPALYTFGVLSAWRFRDFSGLFHITFMLCYLQIFHATPLALSGALVICQGCLETGGNLEPNYHYSIFAAGFGANPARDSAKFHLERISDSLVLPTLMAALKRFC